MSSPYRLPALPDVPTFKEAGVSGVELRGWLGVYGPPRLPEDVRAILGKAIVEVVKQPDVQDKFRAIGFEPTGLGVKEFSAHPCVRGEALDGVFDGYRLAEVGLFPADLSRVGLGSRRDTASVS